ncbi:MAG: sugar phosphate isomerase/epimerase, partial [Clostridia bacterium]|nr:sugar phosphate isomerase/epimerase [Clostridia bacterium]
VNCFLPGSLKVTGPQLDYDALREYIEKGISRGKPLGLEKVVFGSSGARNVPDGWSYEEAYRQIVYFLKEIAAPIAEKYGVIITIEPLRKTDSNIVNSAPEGAALASQADSDSIKCLVDFYHMFEAGDDCETVRKLTGAIKHAHIAEPVSRHYPRKDDGADYKSFIVSLESAGCETCSVEASTDNFERDCAPAFEAINQ